MVPLCVSKLPDLCLGIVINGDVGRNAAMNAGNFSPDVYPTIKFPDEDWAWFEQRCEALGIPLRAGFRTQAEALYSHLTGVNEWMNLTRLQGARDFLKQHLLDSLTCLLVEDVQKLSPDFPCVDLGSGGGYPGLPLACYFPDVPWTLVDSRGKKVKFLQAACALTGNTQAEGKQFRGREAAVMAPFLHQCCQLVVTRATGQTDVLLQECAPMIAAGGCLLLMKGPAYEGAEHNAALKAAKMWHYYHESTQRVQLEDGDPERLLVVFRRKAHVPEE